MSQPCKLLALCRLSRDSSGLQEPLDKPLIAQRELRQRPCLPCELVRIVQRATQNEPSHRIEIGSGCLAPEPHRLQRNRPAACERIQYARCPSFERLPDFLAKVSEFRRAIFLALAAPVQNSAASLLLHSFAARARNLDDLSCNSPEHRAPVLHGTRIRQQRRKQGRPTCRQRSPRRPDVQRRDVPVPYVFLVDGVEGHLLEREGGLDQPSVAHVRGSPRRGDARYADNSRCNSSPSVVSHSQITRISHPSALSSTMLRRSRFMFRSNFSRQKALRVFGVVVLLQPG